MGIYQRPLRPDELQHWGRGETATRHKYIAKIGNRYFYTPEDLQAFKQGVSGRVGQARNAVNGAINTARKTYNNISARAGQAYNQVRGQANATAAKAGIAYGRAKKAYNDNVAPKVNKAKNTASRYANQAYDALGGAEKKRAQESARRANNAKTYVATSRQKMNDAQAQAARDRDAYNKSAAGRVESASRSVNNLKNRIMKRINPDYQQGKTNTRKAVFDKVGGEARSNAQKSAKKANQAKTDYANTRSRAERLQNQANADREAYERTVVGRADAAAKKINRARNEINRRVAPVAERAGEYEDYLERRGKEAARAVRNRTKRRRR